MSIHTSIHRYGNLLQHLTRTWLYTCLCTSLCISVHTSPFTFLYSGMATCCSTSTRTTWMPPRCKKKKAGGFKCKKKSENGWLVGHGGMYIDVCRHVYIHPVQTWEGDMPIPMSIRMSKRTSIRMSMHLSVHMTTLMSMPTYTPVHIHVSAHVNTDLDAHVCTYVSLNACTHVYAHLHTYVHMSTHTSIPPISIHMSMRLSRFCRYVRVSCRQNLSNGLWLPPCHVDILVIITHMLP